MDMLSTSLENGEALETSTQLDSGRPSDPSQAKPNPDEGDDKGKQPESRLDAIKRAAADIEKADPEKPKDEGKPKDGEEPSKPETKPKPTAPKEGDADPAEKETDEEGEGEQKAEQRDQQQDRQQLRHRNGDESPVKAPAHLSREAQEKWTNVPRIVQREIEQHSARTAELSERYEPIRQFDEIARQNGRNLRDSLAEVVRFENMMRENPIAALNHALIQAGPRKADGQPLSLYEVAEYIVQQGQQGYQQTMTQAHERMRQQEATQTHAMQREQQIRMEAEAEALQKHVLSPFVAANPRFHELEPTIAYFLEHGSIDKSLSPSQRLEEAYRLAENVHSSQARQSEPRRETQADRVDENFSDQHRRADESFSGTKSIKGAPASGVDTSSRRKRTMSRGDAISAAMQELGIA